VALVIDVGHDIRSCQEFRIVGTSHSECSRLEGVVILDVEAELAIGVEVIDVGDSSQSVAIGIAIGITKNEEIGTCVISTG
jgi:hypothetical protein